MEKLRIIGCAILEKPPGNGFFSLNQLIEITGLDRIEIRRTLEKLNREKLVVQITKIPKYKSAKGRPSLAITYNIADKKKFKERMAPKMKEGTAQDRMWSIIHAREEFKVRDLIVLADVKRENARWYVKKLRRAEIVQNVGYNGWKLIKDIGPKRPYVG
jgi:Fic family protein